MPLWAGHTARFPGWQYCCKVPSTTYPTYLWELGRDLARLPLCAAYRPANGIAPSPPALPQPPSRCAPVVRGFSEFSAVLGLCWSPSVPGIQCHEAEYEDVGRALRLRGVGLAGAPTAPSGRALLEGGRAPPPTDTRHAAGPCQHGQQGHAGRRGVFGVGLLPSALRPAGGCRYARARPGWLLARGGTGSRQGLCARWSSRRPGADAAACPVEELACRGFCAP